MAWNSRRFRCDVIVHPGVIIGEGIWSSASGGIFRTISKGLRYYTPGGVSIVDVKDVVKAMIILTTSELLKTKLIF